MGTVNKAMQVLEVFSPENPEMGLSELARATKFDKATTLRLLTSMLSHGIVEKTGPAKLYRIGPAVQRLARIRSQTVGFADVAQSILDRLRDETGESCHISEASRAGLATVLAAHSSKSLRVNFELGERLPYHCTASGIAYLAFAPPGVLDEVAKAPMLMMTSRSKTKPHELRERVEQAKRRGFSVNNGEYEAGTISVAAPIAGQDGVAFAAVSVAAPVSRMDPKDIARHAALAMRAAKEIGQSLGSARASR